MTGGAVNGPEAAIVLLSGGLDSTVALAQVLQSLPVALTLTFNYGQRAFLPELQAARAIAGHYSQAHQVVDLPWLADLLPDALTPGKEAQTWDASPETVMAVGHVWVPNRNGVLLNIAASVAEARQAGVVVFGANAEEGADFPDNSPAFREAITRSLSYSTLNQVRVETPVGHLTKPEIVALAIALAVPLELVWSCYEGSDDIQCGVCASCRRLKNALSLAENAGKRFAIPFQR